VPKAFGSQPLPIHVLILDHTLNACEHSGSLYLSLKPKFKTLV